MPEWKKANGAPMDEREAEEANRLWKVWEETEPKEQLLTFKWNDEALNEWLREILGALYDLIVLMGKDVSAMPREDFIDSNTDYARAFLTKHTSAALNGAITAAFSAFQNEFLVAIAIMAGRSPEEAERKFATTRKKFRDDLLVIFADFLEGLPNIDGRGAKAKWNAETLKRAIENAAPHVPAVRWSYGAVAEQITKQMAFDPPLTGEALSKLIKRHKVEDFWKELTRT